MTQVDTCHICLDNIEYIEESIIKDCCNAFICNSCWTVLLNNDDTTQCPICNTSFEQINIINQNINQNDNQNDNYTFNINITINTRYNYKKILKRIFMILKWLLVGYGITNLIIFIIYHSYNEYFSSMLFLSRNIYFWPLCMLYGFLFVSLYECVTDTTCHNWY